MRALPLLLVVGCTFEPGDGFTTLAEVVLVIDAPEPLVVDAAGDAVALDGLTLTTGPLALQELEGGGSFDPANPPPGYTLCHNGHCHADDGSLPTYAEIEAELAGDAASWRTVVEVGLDEVDLGSDAEVALGPVLPSPALPAADIGHLALPVTAVRWGDTEIPVDLQVEGGLALPVDRSSPQEVAITVTWVVDTLVVDDPDDPDPATLAAQLGESSLAGDVE